MVSIELVEKECPECHLLYWISSAHQGRLMSSKQTFFCPNGHTASYPGKTDSALLKEEQAKNERLEGYLDTSSSEIAELNKKIRNCKGQITKLNKKNPGKKKK